MDRKIVIYGNPDKSEFGFPMPGDLQKYITNDVFEVEHGRYRYTQAKDADVIVLSRDGLAYGHLEIENKVKPNDKDRQAYPRVKYVYIVRSSRLYDEPVELSQLGLTRFQFGKTITEEQLADIETAAQGTRDFRDTEFYFQGTVDERERVTRAIAIRRGQPGFRKRLIAAYDGKCAVSRWNAQDALEAAHIVPYSGQHSNEVANGLLLRADVHTLFDLNLFGIEPTTTEIRLVADLLRSPYAEFQGKKLAIPAHPSNQPSKKALEVRWREFNGNRSLG